jgi:threonyl-tRNA synthetase
LERWQLDYNLPARFKLHYVGQDNHMHQPVMIHRAPLGSMERFIGVLIEHFAGSFPVWLAPEQARVITVSEKSEEYGRQVEKRLKAAGLRVKGDYRPEKLGAKIRDGQIEHIPYMLVVGPRDVEANTVSVRDAGKVIWARCRSTRQLVVCVTRLRRAKFAKRTAAALASKRRPRRMSIDAKEGPSRYGLCSLLSWHRMGRCASHSTGVKL